MKLTGTKKQLSIWALALGYFAFYVPYSGMTKSLSKGMFTKEQIEISGFEMLPIVLIGTVIGFLAILAFTGWWRQAGTQSVFNLKIPFASNKYTFFSGVATAVIIATTTLAYSFTGISIVFAALLMRGGVLIMAPMVDIVYRRKIQWYSWLAFGLTLFSLLIVFSEKIGFTLSTAALINIIAYLSGYFFRLQLITYAAKTDDQQNNKQYFVEEMIVAMATILILPPVFALIGQGETMLALRSGYTSFLSSGLIVPTLLIGVLYSWLYIFGSRIYLNHRENTFCVPINRCASLLAGVTSAVLLSYVFGIRFFTDIQLVGAVILVLAIFSLSTPRIIQTIKEQLITEQRTYLFVCPGNTGRSPMAQAICMDKMMAFYENNKKRFNRLNINILSAAISGSEGRPMSTDALYALETLQFNPIDHSSNSLSNIRMDVVDKIWCMSSEHKEEILRRFPEAKDKVFALDREGAIPNPHGQGKNAYVECARQLEGVIDRLIHKSEIAFA